MMRIGNKPIKFELQIDENIPADLIGDELRIKQILNNLLSNAFKYTDAGNVTMIVNAESESSDSKADRKTILKLCIQDTGQGMTQDQLNRLFDEYSRFNEDSKRNIEGTGLGLSIMHRLVKLMNGETHIESEPGKGTIVTVRLPQKLASDEILGPEIANSLKHFQKSNITHRKKIKFKREPMPYGKVLIVDDTETNLFVAARLMKLYSLNIETATNGREAIEKIKAGNVYDVIFMDHMMPEIDGMEATKLLRNSGYLHPIVALTANAVAGQSDIFLENGFDAFLSKPMDIYHLDFILNKYIYEKQPQDVIKAARSLLLHDTGHTDEDTHIDSLLMESFIRDANKAVILLEDLFMKSGYENEEGLRKYITCVHGMRSSLAAINELELSELANKLEKAGRDHSIELINEATSGFVNDLRRLLKKFGTKQYNKTVEETDDKDIHEILPKLIERIEDYDRKGALDILVGIKNCSGENKAMLDAMKEYVIHSEFDDAAKIAAAYINKV